MPISTMRSLVSPNSVLSGALLMIRDAAFSLSSRMGESQAIVTLFMHAGRGLSCAAVSPARKCLTTERQGSELPPGHGKPAPDGR